MGGAFSFSGMSATRDSVMSTIQAILAAFWSADRTTAEELVQIARELLISSELRLALVGPTVEEKPLEELLAF